VSLFDSGESVRFSTSVAAGASGELSKEIESDTTVKRVDVRFYPGPRLDLELVPFAQVGSNRFSLVDLVGRSSIVGDNDVFQFGADERLEAGDRIGVEYTNTDQSNSYDFQVDMSLERGVF
jgi:hypothetical protein